MKKENGFTLVEAIVALLIGSLMLVAIYAAVNSAQRSSSGIERKVVAQQDARSALELMAMETQMASYNPNLLKIWVSSADCSSTADAAHQTYKGIQEATANSLTIEMDINDNGIIDDTASNPNETIKYIYDPANQYIKRSTNCGGNQPFLGATAASAETKTVLVVNGAAGVPVFRYYDGAGAEIAASGTDLGGLIANIRRIEITLVVDSFSSDPATGNRKRVIYSTSVIPRNHIPVATYD
jgi:prepilin-type N-terminal cleavage/methylation domain-containing protein